MPRVRSNWKSSRTWSGVTRYSERQATPAGAARAANTVDVVFRDLGKIVVNNVGDILDMNAARGYVGGHQHAKAPVL